MPGDRGVGLRTKYEQKQNGDGGGTERKGVVVLLVLRKAGSVHRARMDGQEAGRRIEGEERLRDDGMRKLWTEKRAGRGEKNAGMWGDGEGKRGI